MGGRPLHHGGRRGRLPEVEEVIAPIHRAAALEMYSDYCTECVAEGVVPLTFAEWLRDEQLEIDD